MLNSRYTFLFTKKSLAGFLVAALLIAKPVAAQLDTSNAYIQKIIALSKQVEEENKLVGQLQQDVGNDLPIGLKKEIAGSTYIIAIDSAVFKPGGAYFNAYMAIDFPGSTEKLAFAAKNIWFNPKGVGAGPLTRLVLLSDYHIELGPHIKLHLKPDNSNYVEWDCNGFKSISLKGYFEFDSQMLLPDSTSTTEKIVTASFQLITNDLHDFVADISITPFCISGLKDFSFMVTDAIIDLSELQNAAGMQFPQGYPNTGGINSSLWTGFFLRELKVKLPPELSKGKDRIELDVTSFLIDKTGVSGNIAVNNLFSSSDGQMGGWPFSIDKLAVNFVCNQLNGGTLAGEIQLPVTDPNGALKYSATIYHNPSSHEADYAFLIQPKNNLNFSLFGASINLDNTSTLNAVKKNGRFVPMACLNGEITVGPTRVKLPKLKFEKLIVTSEKPYIKGGVFGLSGTGALSVAGFSGSIDSLVIILNNLHPELDITASINFMNQSDNGFAASATARIIGKITELPNSNKTDWSFDRVAISQIGLDVTTQAFRLKGGITFKENDPIYGDGFFGGFLFEMSTEASDFSIAVNGGFGSKAALRYWYVDGIVSVPIPVGPIAQIKRLMGGMYYHMRPTTSFSDMAASMYKNTKSVIIPINYVPDATAGYGFRAGVTFSSLNSETAFNGDVLLTVNLNSNGGLSNLELDGTIASMCTIKERMTKPITDQKIYGTMQMVYDNTNKSFHALITANINVLGVVKGSGQMVIHFDPHTWHVYVGTPSKPVNVTLVHIASATSYFMMGENLPGIPSPPKLVTDILGNVNSSRNLSKLADGSGVAVGMTISASQGTSFGYDCANIYYALSAVIGFDVTAENYGSKRCSTTNTQIGINGWYFQGQAYLALAGSFGAHVDCEIWGIGIKQDLKVLDLSTAILLQAEVPNPSYFTGTAVAHLKILSLFELDYDVSVEYGKHCGSLIN